MKFHQKSHFFSSQPSKLLSSYATDRSRVNTKPIIQSSMTLPLNHFEFMLWLLLQKILLTLLHSFCFFKITPNLNLQQNRNSKIRFFWNWNEDEIARKIQTSTIKFESISQWERKTKWKWKYILVNRIQNIFVRVGKLYMHMYKNT